jgi:hypothetical protein
MKKISLTLRVPIFADVDLEIEDKDFEDLIEEWDKSNFGVVKGIVEQYVDLEDASTMGASERFGDTEIVDVRSFGEIIIEKEPDIDLKTDEVEINTIAPKGKPN